MDIIKAILANKDSNKTSKIVRLWAVVQLNYRTPLGDKAWATIGNLTDGDTVSAIAFLTGWCMGAGGCPTREKLMGLVPEYKEGK